MRSFFFISRVILSRLTRVILRSVATKDRFPSKAVELPRGRAILQSLRSFRMTPGPALRSFRMTSGPALRSLRMTTGALAVTLAGPSALHAQTATSIAPYIAPAFPSDLVSAKRADRIAWLAYDHGQRNAYAAVAPDFKPVRLTSFLNDDGVVLTDLSISDDGSTVVFVRGSAPNREGWIANPSSDVAGADRTIWAARTSGGAAWKLAEGSAPALSPDGHSVAFAKDGQIFRVRVAQGAPVEKDRPAARQGVGAQRHSPLVAGRVQARVRQRP